MPLLAVSAEPDTWPWGGNAGYTHAHFFCREAHQAVLNYAVELLCSSNAISLAIDGRSGSPEGDRYNAGASPTAYPIVLLPTAPSYRTRWNTAQGIT